MKNHTTMTDEQHAAEAATVEAMHTGDYSAPDLEYTPIPDPLPAVVRREELDAARADLAVCAEVLRWVANVLRGGDFPMTAAVADEHAARIAARWGSQP